MFAPCLGDFLSGAPKRPDLDAVLLEFSYDRLGQPDGAGGIAVDAHGIGGDVYVPAALGLHLSFGDDPDDPVADLAGVELLGDAAGEDDLAVVVVLAVGVELSHHRLVHFASKLVGHGGPHAEEQEAGVDPLDRLDDRARELLVAGGDHVEGAVGLYVLDLHVIVAGELAQSTELINDLVVDLVRWDVYLPAAEAD